MTEFTPFASFSGGLLIGLAAVSLMALYGRIAGMTGILEGVLPPFAEDWLWRVLFLAGAITAPAIYQLVGGTITLNVPVSTPMLAVGGLVVGVGVTLGSGCTSGHGVCGIARLSRRSLWATATFMGSAIATVFIIRHVIGG